MHSPRKRARCETALSDKALKYFDPLEEKEVNGVLKKFYKCKECNNQINGSKTHNLVVHLLHKHNEIHDEISGKKKTIFL